jgi:long-chain acyl-CoA synthetase
MNKSLIKYIEQAINSNLNKKALSDYQGRTLTYMETAQQINNLHSVFKKMNIKHGDKIALIGKNSLNWAIVYLSAITYGAVIVPVLPDFHSADVIHILNHSDSVFLFASVNHFEQIDETQIPNINIVLSLEDFSILYTKKKNTETVINKIKESSFNTTLNEVNFKDYPLDNLTSLVYTSGTTGYSKGVMLSLNSLTQNFIYAKNNMPLKSGDNILSFLPLAHAYGCSFEFIFPFCIGCHITFLNKIPSPKIIVKAFSEIKPQLVLSVPLVIEKVYFAQVKPIISTTKMQILLQTPIISKIIKKKINAKLTDAFGGNFHEIVIGGAAMNIEVEDFFTSIGFKFTIGYGMTECGPLITYCPWNKRTPHTCGKVVHSLQIKIDSPDQENIVGEILVKGANVMNGYYKNPEASNEALDDEGWLHTGDLGIVDKEGFVYIKGRKKNMLLGPSGQNIYPEEIEAKLNSMKYIMESLVLEDNGKIVALIYPDYAEINNDNYSEKDIEKILEKKRNEINTQLPDYSKIMRVKLVPQEFEKTPTKKIKRFLYNY